MSLSSQQKWTRRNFLKTTAVASGGLAAFSSFGSCITGQYTRGGKQGPSAKTLSFNTNWLFGEAVSGCATSDFDDSHLEKVVLPHTVTPLSWRKWDPKDWEKSWCYRRHFHWDGNTDNRVFLDIGAAMTAATISLNGQEIGRHVGGYLPFQFELTKVLQQGENILAVELDSRFSVNVPPNKPEQGVRSVDFWQPGGLYRSASLHFVPSCFIADVFAKPVNVLNPGDRRLDIICKIDMPAISPGDWRLEVELLDGEKLLAKKIQPVISLHGENNIPISLEGLQQIQLWDIENPKLYTVKTKLLVDNKLLHDHAVKTGFRDAQFTKEGFFLNGKRVQLFGVNRHQFYPFAGGAMPARVQRKDVELLKQDLNCNMVRCSHYPQDEAFFDACDELGLMAWEEAAGWGRPLGNEEWKQRAINAVEDMIRRDRNHPSIIIWGARLNETPDDVQLYTQTKELAYRLDGSRQTTGAMVGGLHDTKNFVQDVFSYNDYKKSKAANGKWQPELLPPRTDLPYLVSEAVGTLSGPARYYRRIDEAVTQQGQALAHARVHNIAGADKRYCGLLTWSGFDYPSGSGNQFEGVKYTGVIDLFRVPKPEAAIYRSQVDPGKRAVIAPAFYWHFGTRSLPFKKGERAMICSNCDRLELFIDNTRFATVRPDRKQFSHLPFPPSFVDFSNLKAEPNAELEITGYVGAQKMLSKKLSADSSKDRFRVVADDKELTADGTDATRIMFYVADQYGNLRPYTKGDVSFQLEGPAILVGDNPFAFEDAGGVGAVWLRTVADKKGKIHLTLHHKRWGSHSVVIHAI